MPTEPSAQAPPIHQKVPRLQCLRQETAVCLLTVPGREAAALLPAAPSQGLCYTLQILTGEGVSGGDLYLSTWCQILLSLLAFTSQMALYTQPSS